MTDIEKALRKASDTKCIIVENGAHGRVPEVFRNLFPGQTAVIVADSNTYAAAGADVEAILGKASIPLAPSFVFDDPELYAEWSYLERLEDYLKGIDAIAVAVGSGVINDLTKLASSHLGRQYMVVGTAASMDGYTASGASVTYDGIKQTFACPAPRAAILDPAVSAAAPEGLSASGYGDMIAKIPAGAEWIIAGALGKDPVDPVAFSLVQDGLRDSLADPEGLAAGKVEPTKLLANELVLSGLAMQECGSSRPASGIEHQFSHFWDMEGLCFRGKHVSHGFKVAIGTLVSTAMLEFLLENDIENIDPAACAAAWPSMEDQAAMIREMFAGRPHHMERALAQSAEKYLPPSGIEKELTLLRDQWPDLKEKIRSQIFTYAKVKEGLRLAGAPYEPEMIGISRSRLRETFLLIPYMRSRYTAADVILRTGLLDKAAESLFGPGGIWEVG